jgi:hypothetical protein
MSYHVSDKRPDLVAVGVDDEDGQRGFNPAPFDAWV